MTTTMQNNAKDAPVAMQQIELRDWFAGHALAGISANPELQREPYASIAQWAYEQADAMLKARETPNE